MKDTDDNNEEFDSYIDEEIEQYDDAYDEQYPLVALRDVVIFPSMATAILVGRQPSVNAVERAIESDKILFVLTQRSPSVNEPEPEDLYSVGCIVRIGLFLRLPDGTIKVMLEGLSRARVEEFVEYENYTAVRISSIDAYDPGTREIEALSRKVAALFDDYANMNKRVPEEVIPLVRSMEDKSDLADTIAAHILVKNRVKQDILEAGSLKERYLLLNRILTEELQILKVEKDIDDKVSSQVQKTQKELFLQEKMKAIKQELGQSDDLGEYAELEEKITKAKMSKEAEKVAMKELDRLKKMSPIAPEANVVRNYIDTMVSLPWNRKSKDNLNIEKVKEKLDADHYGLGKVKERVLEFLSVIKLVKKLKGPILCFVGPPGVGKTSLGMSIAEAVGRKFVRVSLGGTRDEAAIKGHRRTYIGSMPGRIIQSIIKAGTRNPVFLLDEIDKLGADFRGDPSSALLELLDPEQNMHFSDHYLEVEFDMSETMFITTANVIHTIPPALKDRMEIIRLPGYLLHEKVAIAKKFLLPKLKDRHGIKYEQLSVSRPAIRNIIRLYTREAGVRNLERELASICRKVAKKLASGGKRSKRVKINSGNLEKYLGIPRFTENEIDENLSVGIATGLAWTQAGGEILNIEVNLMPGKGELILTGKLGDVMQESAKIAMSYAREKARMLPFQNDFLSSVDVHVHVPEGAIPKDGPSAGVAMATALVSALFNIPIRRHIAMTGEVTLRGKVLQVGGLNEKSVAALRAGIKKILIPKDNTNNIKELPAEVKKKVDIQPVGNMDEVLELVLSKKLSWGVKKRKTKSDFFGDFIRNTTN
jgi:ATP-dependent Lon protease